MDKKELSPWWKGVLSIFESMRTLTLFTQRRIFPYRPPHIRQGERRTIHQKLRSALEKSRQI